MHAAMLHSEHSMNYYAMRMHKTQLQQAMMRRLTRLLQRTSGLTLGEELRLLFLALSPSLTAFLKVSTCNMPQLLEYGH